MLIKLNINQRLHVHVKFKVDCCTKPWRIFNLEERKREGPEFQIDK